MTAGALGRPSLALRAGAKRAPRTGADSARPALTGAGGGSARCQAKSPEEPKLGSRSGRSPPLAARVGSGNLETPRDGGFVFLVEGRGDDRPGKGGQPPPREPLATPGTSNTPSVPVMTAHKPRPSGFPAFPPGAGPRDNAAGGGSLRAPPSPLTLP